MIISDDKGVKIKGKGEHIMAEAIALYYTLKRALPKTVFDYLSDKCKYEDIDTLLKEWGNEEKKEKKDVVYGAIFGNLKDIL